MSEESPELPNQVSTMPGTPVNYQVSGGINVSPTFENNVNVGAMPQSEAPVQPPAEPRRIEVLAAEPHPVESVPEAPPPAAEQPASEVELLRQEVGQLHEQLQKQQEFQEKLLKQMADQTKAINKLAKELHTQVNPPKEENPTEPEPTPTVEDRPRTTIADAIEGLQNEQPTAQEDEYDYNWQPRAGDATVVHNPDGTVERNWSIDSEIFEKDGKKYVRVRKSDLHTTLDVPYEDLMQWHGEEFGYDDTLPEEGDDEQTRWQKVKNKLKAIRNGRYVGPAVVAGWMWGRKDKFEDDPNLSEEEKEKRRRRRRLGLAAGALLLGVGAALLLRKYGLPGFGDGGDGGVVGPEVVPPVSPEAVDLSGINPDSINAANADEFQRGVLDLLERQSVHTQGVTPEKLEHMNNYMETQGVASGMKMAPNGLEQNVVNFPQGEGSFPNVNASSEQGFRLGASGTGREQLEAWVREAERAGITFTRG